MTLQSSTEISNNELLEFVNEINNRYGYDFSGYSQASFKRRVLRFMAIQNLSSISDLKKLILKEPDHFAHFIEEVTVGLTDMFRDPEFYKKLREKILPQLATYPHIKIWHAGCSTGEEVYSLAIMLHEERLYSKSLLYGTDINQRDLAKAKEGIFPLGNIPRYTKNYIESGGQKKFSEYYFGKYKGALFDPALKQNMVFAVHNLVSDKSFNEFNLIVCRNVLIYFNKLLQDKVIKLFYDSLCMFGYLALGEKESLLFSEIQNKFEIVDKEEKIYRKIK